MDFVGNSTGQTRLSGRSGERNVYTEFHTEFRKTIMATNYGGSRPAPPNLTFHGPAVFYGCNFGTITINKMSVNRESVSTAISELERMRGSTTPKHNQLPQQQARDTNLVVTHHPSPVTYPNSSTSSDKQKSETVWAKIDELVGQNDVVIFSKTCSPPCNTVKALFNDLKVNVTVVELDTMSTEEGTLWQDILHAKTNQRTVPNVFVKGQHIGGCDDTFQAHEDNKLLSLIHYKSHVL